MFAAYCFGLAPLLEPPPKEHVVIESKAATANQGEFAGLFEEGSWQLENPFSMKTDRGTVLFGDYRMEASGEVTAWPISMVVQTAGSPAKPGRVFVLNAEDGALLTFENGLDLSKNANGMGKLLHARLLGPVTIHSPPSSPQSNDELTIKTRGIQVDQASINTAQPIDMRYGPHQFQGQDFKLSFLDPEQKLKTSGVNRWAFSNLEITQVDLVQFYVDGDGVDLFGDSAKKPAPEAVSVEVVKSPAATPIEIRCQGRFKIDFLKMEGSFKDHVEVLRLPVRGQADSLRCDVLTLEFESGSNSNSESSNSRNELSKFSPTLLKAVGRPVVLSSPSADVQAKCSELEYAIRSRKISLKDSKQVILNRGTSEFKAPSIEYTLAKIPRRLGRLHAKGKGEMTAVDAKNPSRSIRAEWDQELELEPEGDLHRLEMRAAAGLFLAGDEHRFTAREMKLWLEECEPATTSQAKLSKSNSKTRRASWQDAEDLPAPQQKKTGKPQMLFDVRPHRMLAIGSVEANTPELQGHTQRMELIFHYPEPIEPSPNATTQSAPTKPKRPKEEQGPPEAKYDLVGDFIKVEIESEGQQEPTIREVTVHKNLRFERFDLTDKTAPPLRVSGDQFKLTGGIRGDAEVVISGAPAEVSAEGMTIEGPEIHLQQRRNRVYIEQPGKLKITEFASAADLAGNPSAANSLGQSLTPKLIEVEWQGRMEFDGTKVEFKKQVVTNLLLADREGVENEVEIDSGTMEIYLTRPISFGTRASLPNAGYGEDLGLDRLVFDEGVDVTNDAFDTNDRRTAFDQLHARNLSYDHLSGGFKADGPGFVSSVRRGVASSSSGGAFAFPVGKLAAKPSAAPPKPGASKSGLTYIRVDFDGAITGNVIKRDLTFDRRVNAVYSPVAAWDSVIDPNHRGGLGEQGIALRCDEMSFYEVAGASPDQSSFEFEARENVMIEGSQFIAYGSKTKYAPSKRLVILEGNPRKDCEIHKLNDRGVEEGKQAAGRMTYRTDTREVSIQDVGLGQINETPQMKIPKTGGVRPQGSVPNGTPKTGPAKPNIYRPGQR